MSSQDTKNSKATCISRLPLPCRRCSAARFDKCFIVYALSSASQFLSPPLHPTSSRVNVFRDRRAFCFFFFSFFFVKCCFSVSRAFDVFLDCCSSASLGRDHRQHLLICRFTLTAKGLLAAGPPHAFFPFSLFFS